MYVWMGRWMDRWIEGGWNGGEWVGVRYGTLSFIFHGHEGYIQDGYKDGIYFD